MAVSDATIQELKQILNESGKEITEAEASEILRGLIGYFDTLAKIYHREKTKNDNDDNKPRIN